MHTNSVYNISYMRHKYLLLGQCSDHFEIYTYLTIEFVKRNF
jgi:hypothetical protein